MWRLVEVVEAPLPQHYVPPPALPVLTNRLIIYIIILLYHGYHSYYSYCQPQDHETSYIIQLGILYSLY